MNTDLFFSSCFDKHSFQELNNIDKQLLFNAFNFYKSISNKNRDSIFFDVGTNAGSFVKILKMFNIEKNIHCFEPHPILNKKTLSIYPYVNMNNFCLGNIDGNIDIYIPKYSIGLSSIINRPVFSNLNQEVIMINVKCMKLDTYCKENNIEYIDFIKIDVEGAEKMVLEGATELLQNKKIFCGIFEVGQTLIDANTSDNEICNMLINYGYQINKKISGNDYMFYLPSM